MSVRNNDQMTLIENIAALPPEKVTEVEDYVDFLRLRLEDRRSGKL